MVRDAARGRHRGHPRRRLQPHRRGQPPGPDAVASGASTTRPTTGSSTTTRSYYYDTTGTGNTPADAQPARAAADHGLAALLGDRDARRRLPLRPGRDAGPAVPRGRPAVARSSTWCSRTRCVSQVKLIAEPWDVGEGGYQVGNFPPLWTEWNGKYRDTVRDFWRGEPATLARVRLPAHRLGRPLPGRRPAAAAPRINFVTAHDGFTLRDLVSYNEKHNEANGEGNSDGESHNRSWNCGVEGATDDPEVLALRARQKRNFLATLLLLARACRCCCTATSSAAPSSGNNNVYCQDNELAWVDWDGRADDWALLDFTARAGRSCARDHPVFRRRRFFHGRPARGSQSELARHRLVHPGRRAHDRRRLGRRLRPVARGVPQRRRRSPSPDRRGERIVDDSFLLLFNGHHERHRTSPLPARGRTASAGRSCSTRARRRWCDDRPTAEARRAG